MESGVTFDSLLFDYLMATERSVGRRWEIADYTVSEEHVATATIETVISLLAGMLDQPEDAPHVVVATAQGDNHSLPGRAIAANLLFLGYRTTFLGANVPGRDLKSFLEDEPPVAVVVSAAMTSHLLGARAVVQAAHDAGVPAVVGGKAFGPEGEWAEAVGADAWLGSLRDVEGIIEMWVGEAPEPAEAPQLSEEVEEMVSVRSSVLAGAETEMATRTGRPIPQRLRDELRLLLAAVEGALLTGDDRVVADMLDWQERSLDAHGFDASLVARSLQSALDASETTGGPLLARVRAERQT